MKAAFILQSSWDNFQIFSGSNTLVPWSSLGKLGGFLIMLGFIIRGFVMLAQALKGDGKMSMKIFINFFISGIIALVITAVL